MIKGNSKNINKGKISLTPRQNEVYDFIKSKIQSNYSPPTITEIMHHFKLKSTNGINDMLNVLETKGYIRRITGKSRGIELCEQLSISPTVSLPVRKTVIVGDGDAQNPFSVFMSPIGEILLDQNFFPNNVFMGVVADDAMDNEGIFKGDYVIVRQANNFEDKSLVFAIVGNKNVVRRLNISARDEKSLISVNRFYSKILDRKSVV